MQSGMWVKYWGDIPHLSGFHGTPKERQDSYPNAGQHPKRGLGFRFKGLKPKLCSTQLASSAGLSSQHTDSVSRFRLLPFSFNLFEVRV